jgi:hypothetical protein
MATESFRHLADKRSRFQTADPFPTAFQGREELVLGEPVAKRLDEGQVQSPLRGFTFPQRKAVTLGLSPAGPAYRAGIRCGLAGPAGRQRCNDSLPVVHVSPKVKDHDLSPAVNELSKKFACLGEQPA